MEKNMSLKSLIISAPYITLLACTANNSDTLSQKNQISEVTTCPSDQVITNDEQYVDTAPEASDDYVKWHEKNSLRDDVTTLKSGLQYKIVNEGISNGVSPIGPQVIKANYHGYFPDGNIFDSSYERGQPLEYNANAFIKGWNEALAMMKPCSAWILYVPGDLAYGPAGRPGIPADATLIFNMQLLEVK